MALSLAQYLRLNAAIPEYLLKFAPVSAVRLGSALVTQLQIFLLGLIYFLSTCYYQISCTALLKILLAEKMALLPMS